MATDTTTIKESQTEATDSNVARVAGRGTIYITAAKLWFIVTGYGIEVALSWLMTEANYGVYKVVIGAVSIVNAVVIAGTYQTVSRHISQAPEKADSVKWKSLRLQSLVGGGISLGFFLLAPVTANYLNDPHLTNYLRLASLITLAYSFYAVYTGYFNGQKRFLAQASLDITYSTLKLGFIFTLVWLGYGVAGGVGGFALAAASVLAVAAIAGRGNERRGDVKAAELLKFQSYLLVFTLVLNLLQKVDLMLIKSLSSPVPQIASEQSAYYSAAINLANITYQIIISVTFIVFPLVSESVFAQDRERTASYISTTFRYSLIVMALVATLFSANASESLRVVFPESYQVASGALTVIAYGMLLFGLLYIATTIISASGQAGVSLAIGAITLVANIAFNAFLIPRFGITGAALGTTASMLAGVVAGGSYLIWKFGALIPLKSALRITLCAGLVYGLSFVATPQSRLLIIVQLVILSVVYLCALIVTGEVGKEELSSFAKVIKPQKGSVK